MPESFKTFCHHLDLWRCLGLATAVAIFLGVNSVSLARADRKPPNELDVEVDSADPLIARFYLTTKRMIEGTAIFRADLLDNAVPSSPLPLSIAIRQPYQRFEFLRIAQKKPGAWHYNWSYKCTVGLPSASKSVDYIYSLPYPRSKKYLVTQSFLGSFSHFAGSDCEYAVDFRMPEGSTVCAARPGTVVAYRVDSTAGGESTEFKNDANEVVISHGDGTYGTYVHLKTNGVLVKLGQSVAQGDAIALSGATGRVTEPHLHFQVFRRINSEKIETIPFQMRTPAGVLRKLEEQTTY